MGREYVNTPYQWGESLKLARANSMGETQQHGRQVHPESESRVSKVALNSTRRLSVQAIMPPLVNGPTTSQKRACSCNYSWIRQEFDFGSRVDEGTSRVVPFNVDGEFNVDGVQPSQPAMVVRRTDAFTLNTTIFFITGILSSFRRCCLAIVIDRYVYPT
jgi:hypothetical protein